MKVLFVAETLEPRDGWASYSLGLLQGLLSLGVRARVLLDRRAPPPTPPVEWIACLSSPLAALVRPEAMLWNAAQIVKHRGQSELLHWLVEPYLTAAVPGLLPPYCVTLHGTYAVSPFRERWPTPWLFRRALRAARRVFCVSTYTSEAVSAQVRLENLEVIHNGHAWPVAAPEMTPPQPLPDAGRGDRGDRGEPSGPCLLGVGALKERKGYHVALKAVARLQKRYGNICYRIIGDDSDRKYVDHLRELIAQLGLERNVEMLGKVDEATLRTSYEKADAFVLAPVNSGQSFEGYGIAYLEAGAHALPVVGSAGCGAAEAVDDCETGFLAPQGDDSALAEHIARLLDDRALAARLGENGRRKAERQRWEQVARRYLEAYERCLGD